MSPLRGSTDSPPRTPSPWFTAAAVLWPLAVTALFVHECAAYFARIARDVGVPAFPGAAWGAIPLWGGHLLKTAGAALFLLSGEGLGRGVLRAAGRRVDGKGDGVEGLLERILLGSAVWALAGFSLAAAGLSSPGFLRAVSAGWAVVWVLRDLRRPDSVLRSLRGPRPSAAGPGGALAGMVLLAAALLWTATMVPEIFGDTLHYTLAVPEAWLRGGRLVDLPGNCNVGFPGLAQAFYLWGLAWSDDRFCKLMNWGVSLLWAGSVGLWTRNRWGREAGLWSALFLLSAPLAGLYIWSATADVFSGALLFAAFARWLKAWEEEVPGRPSSFLLSGLLLGAAGAAKYTALVSLPWFLADGLVRCRREGRIPRLPVLCFGAGMLAPLLPWWVLNVIRHGNPVYPYAASWLGPLSAERKDLLAFMLRDQRGDLSFPRRLALLFTSSLNGVRDGRSGFIGPMFLALAPFFWTPARVSPSFKRAAAAVGSFTALVYVSFVLTTSRLRFILPLLGVFMAGAGAAAAETSRRLGRGGPLFRSVLGAAAGSQILCLLWILYAFYGGFDVILGRETAERYLRASRPLSYQSPVQGAYDFLKTVAAPGDKVYVLGEIRTFRCPVEAYANTLYDVPLYARWFEEGLSPEAVVRRLSEEGFTHVVLNTETIHTEVMARYLTPEWASRLEEVFRRLGPPLYRDEWTVLFRVPRNTRTGPPAIIP